MTTKFRTHYFDNAVMDLPGMWERADFMGGWSDTDGV